MFRILPVCILAAGLYGCIAPVNLTYESARTLEQGAVDIQGNAAIYYWPNQPNLTQGPANLNYGLKIGYGVTDRYTAKLRYEHLRSPDIMNPFRDLFPDANAIYLDIDYFEIENKFALKRPGRAISVPVAYYSTGAVTLDPRFYFTFENSRKTVEFSVIPKVHVFLGPTTYVMPGVSLGLGLSKDFSKWAFRPEVGWDGFVAFGAAFNYRLFAGRGNKE